MLASHAPAQPPADRQHDQADDRLRGDAGAAARQDRPRRALRPEYGESLLGLRPGQRISVRDLLYGLILRSGNDAAHDLALAAAGSEQRFVAQMNRYAAALGLSDTHYANPVGLDQQRQLLQRRATWRR